MGSKLNPLKEVVAVPGAGSYNPVKETTVKKYPSFSMGAKLKSELDTKLKTINVPGPGTYVNEAQRLRHSSPSYGFGTMQRPDIAKVKNPVPGPGNYQIKSMIGEATQSLSKQ